LPECSKVKSTKATCRNGLPLQKPPVGFDKVMADNGPARSIRYGKGNAPTRDIAAHWFYLRAGPSASGQKQRRRRGHEKWRPFYRRDKRAGAGSTHFQVFLYG